MPKVGPNAGADARLTDEATESGQEVRVCPVETAGLGDPGPGAARRQRRAARRSRLRRAKPRRQGGRRFSEAKQRGLSQTGSGRLLSRLKARSTLDAGKSWVKIFFKEKVLLVEGRILP